jgi:hypothetical protein
MARVGVLLLMVAAMAPGCSTSGLFRQFEYEEDVYLSLDGSATVYVNSSLAALNALRGTSFDTAPNAPLDRQRVAGFFTTPVTRDVRVTTSRRNGRRFVHVRLDVNDVRRLGEAAPFAWSKYEFKQDGELVIYRQELGAAAGKSVSDAGWKGGELVAVRLHLPSKIEYHTLPGVYKRGNILVWEQPLTARLRSEPLALEARVQTQSILYRTLWLFGATFAAVVAAFALLIWWILRRGAAAAPGPERLQGTR